MDEARRPEPGMDPAQDVEGHRVSAFEIDGHDRETGLLDELDDVFRPRDVFHDIPLPEGGPGAVGVNGLGF